MARPSSVSETVKFNVGGKIFEVLREPTLSSHPESLLSILVEESEGKTQDKTSSSTGHDGDRQHPGGAEGRDASELAEVAPAGEGEAGGSGKGASSLQEGEQEAAGGEAAAAGKAGAFCAPIFVEGNPELFPYVLDYLRYRRIIIPYTVAKAAMLREARKYGLAEVTEDSIEREPMPLGLAHVLRARALEVAIAHNKEEYNEASLYYATHHAIKLALEKLETCRNLGRIGISAQDFNHSALMSVFTANISIIQDHCSVFCEPLGLSVTEVNKVLYFECQRQ